MLVDGLIETGDEDHVDRLKAPGSCKDIEPLDNTSN